jgi:UDP-N-acetylmuramate--alanine ligase
MAAFSGAKRRFDFHLKESLPGGHVIIDDYAHHPDELRASIASVKALYPGHRLTVAFQPHLYSRTRDFAPEFADALSAADEIILLDIYPARELPIPGISSKTIFDLINNDNKVMISKQLLPETIKNRNFEILLTVGAGDINTFIPDILNDLNK